MKSELTVSRFLFTSAETALVEPAGRRQADSVVCSPAASLISRRHPPRTAVARCNKPCNWIVSHKSGSFFEIESALLGHKVAAKGTGVECRKCPTGKCADTCSTQYAAE